MELSDIDLNLLVLDFPRPDRCDGASWHTTLDAFVAAATTTGAPCMVLATLRTISIQFGGFSQSRSLNFL